ncbi:zinc-ribbon domain-containing protein [Bifidobacterium sp. SMB2]|uniref:Zinc-ribbon domain-containing protein n=1 Tax=Bifidobacterium saimiriisciurei TaxID=2661627 RepID=A0ABX0CCQ5_9BIFI|nr:MULTISPECIES: zinc ribbon domain-containing protein [Bifidobacterium]NEG96764.1 zinc-ribbon domain-containing protein [Bifidobacterium sp. SMB2]NEH12330.1 zinc-ribbon domain-containing protein [Bifidobacterium saimiriisciurei]
MKFCTNCGEQLDEEASFCTNCGQPVDDAELGDTLAGDPALGETIIRGSDDPQSLPAIDMPEEAPVQAAPTVSMTPVDPQPRQTVPAAGSVAPQPQAGQPAAPGAAGGNGNGPKKKNLPLIIIASVIAAALFICGGIVYAYNAGAFSDDGDQNSEPTATATVTKTATSTPTASSSSPTPSQTATTKAAPALDPTKLDAIVNKYSASNSAVAVVPVNGAQAYYSQQANSKYVASGLYLPVYLEAHSTGNSTAASYADAMMKTMSNEYGNSAISAMGGRSSLNSWLSSQGYTNTDFERDFGDVSASSAGYENYTSAADAAKMLVATEQAGGTGLMAYSLASEGVSAPAGTSINGHRGQGIKNAYNFFIVMKSSKGAVGVAVMTQNQGRSVAVQMANDILAEVNAELLK